MEQLYETILVLESQSGKQRWNEICNDIVDVYMTIFKEEEWLYTRDELWKLLFEPTINVGMKKNKLKQVLSHEYQAAFFLKNVPILLQDNPQEVIALVKRLNKK